MIYAVIAYFLTFIIVISFKRHKIKHLKLPSLKLKKEGIVFFANGTYRFKLFKEKVQLVEKTLYLKRNDKLILITNVLEAKIYNSYLYFKVFGEVKIIFDCSEIYRYFAISIKSNQFDLENLKQQAMLELLNNGFDIIKCKIMKRYINIIDGILNIKFDKDKIVVRPNKYNFSYTLTYKLNNKIKRVYINQTF